MKLRKPQSSSVSSPFLTERSSTSTTEQALERLRLPRQSRISYTTTLKTSLLAPPPSVLRGLCFDIENKPGTYGGGDYTFPKVTAIGCQFLDEEFGCAWVLNREKPSQMLDVAEQFRAEWDEADFVVAHNGRRHDMKILDGLYTSLELPLLARKRMVDTYMDQPKMAGFSRSLENLAARWGCPEQKMPLSEFDWERAYDGIPAGVNLMRRRVASDVRITIWLYHKLLEKGLLKF